MYNSPHKQGGCNTKNRRLQQISKFKFGTVFSVFCFFPVFYILFWPSITGLVVLVGYNSFYKTFAGFYRH